MLLIGGGAIPLLSVVSCSSNNKNDINLNDVKTLLEQNEPFDFYDYYSKNNNLNEQSISKLIEEQIDEIMMNYWNNWFQNLSYNEWKISKNKKIENLFCTSQRQAIALYTCVWGHFWNEPLHNKQNIEEEIVVNEKFLPNYFKPYLANPKNTKVKGSDWEYIESALSNSTSPISLTVYHGVEYMENEFWDQLKDFIIQKPNGKLDYSQVVGTTITSNGFISTSLNKTSIKGFANGFNWTNDKYEPPLKEPAIFKINFYKGQKNVAYVSGFDLVKQNGFSMINLEEQFLINRNTQFKITNVYQENNINVFEMDLLN